MKVKVKVKAKQGREERLRTSDTCDGGGRGLSRADHVVSRSSNIKMSLARVTHACLVLGGAGASNIGRLMNVSLQILSTKQ